MLLILSVVLLLLAAAAGLTWYLSFGLGKYPPARSGVAGLGQEARLDWQAQRAVSIAAASWEDAYAALGYAHGMTHTWQVLLWRQTALGRLSMWFGDDLNDVDRAALQLGFASLGRQAYATLSEADRQLAQAYTNGLNAALQSRPGRLQDALILLDVQPDAWEPWHTLALERLFAWLSVPSTTLSTDANLFGEDAAALAQASGRLRRWLHLHGFENSAAWVVRDSVQTLLFQRHVYGATAQPLLLEVALSLPGQNLLLGASLPGTPFFVAGRTAGRAWALLLDSTVRYEKAVQDTARRPVYERLIGAGGDERLVAVRRSGTALQFAPPPRPLVPAPPPSDPPPSVDAPPPPTGLAQPTGRDTLPPPPDSTWYLRWTGFSATTDWTAWRALLLGETPTFTLFDGDLLLLSSDGTWEVQGSPLVSVPLASGRLIGNTSWSSNLAIRLDSLARRPQPTLTPQAWISDFHSPWAARLAPGLIASLDSLGASIFETWTALYREERGRLPTPAARDTTGLEGPLQVQLFNRTIDLLTARLGSDLSLWRWEHVVMDRRFFPVWSADSLYGSPFQLDVPAAARYAPLALPGRGHPTALAWGPSPVQEGPLSPAAWESWIGTASWARLMVRRRIFDIERPLGRSLVSDRAPDPVAVDTVQAPLRTTFLIPE